MAESKVKNPTFIALSHTMKNSNAYAADSMHTEAYNFSSQIPDGYSIMAIRGIQATGGYFLAASVWASGTSVYAILSAKTSIPVNTYDIVFHVVCCKTELLGGVNSKLPLSGLPLGGRHDQSCYRRYKSKVLYDNHGVGNVFTNCSDRDDNNDSVNNICDVKFGPDLRIYRIWCDGSKCDKSGGYDDNQHNGSNPMVCALFKWCGNRQNTKSTIAVKEVA